jgi:phosphatidate cytidylyltransferase
VWKGGWLFIGLLSLTLLVALWEFLRLAKRGGYRVLPVPGLLAGLVLVALAVTQDTRGAGVGLLAIGIWMTVLTLRAPIEGRMVGLAMTGMGVVYVVGLGIHHIWLREMAHGLPMVVLVFLGTWAADTFAFFVGVRFGKTPLAPQISPGKSVEGLWGGILGSVLVVLLAAVWLLPELAPGRALLLGAVIGAVAPLGDLLESLVKRNCDAKDSSGVIPGHGGVLDRIDSLLITGPVAYYLFRILLPA